MFGTYLLRELSRRKKQTAIISIGMALAIALVILVNAVSLGVRDAQASVLSAVYGVGTDITVTEEPVEGEAGDRPGFAFGSDDGETDGSTREIAQSQLTSGFGTTTFDAAALEAVAATSNVDGATATLALTNSTFSGEMPDFGAERPAPGEEPAEGGADGAGGSEFSVDSFTVTGVDPAETTVGPLTAVSVSDGRALAAADAGSKVAVLDASYATTAELVVDDTVEIGGEEFTVVGIVASTSSEAATASNVFIPLDVAQSLAELEGQVSTIYVRAATSTAIEQIQADVEEALPDATVSTQADLASSVSGSLTTASDLVSNLGTWLSVIVLAAAFLSATLFTISGVGRRTREFGTLKAIGWKNRRIVGQVAGESLVQGLIGGALGIGIGLGAIAIVNSLGLSLAASQAATTTGRPGFGRPGAAEATPTLTDVVLTAPVSLTIIGVAVGLAVLGGLVAGALGGWRASRLRPAEALRSVA